MSTLLQSLNDTIRRTVRREIKVAMQSWQKERRQLKKALAEVKKQLAKTRPALTSQVMVDTEEAAAPQAGQRISARGVRAMRRKLQLTQAAFAKLAGVSTLTIMKIEKKEGPLNIRSKTRAALLKLRAMSAKEVRVLLEQPAETDAVADKKTAAKARGKRKSSG